MQYVSDLLSSVETPPSWIEQAEIDHLEDNIISKPPETQTLFKELVLELTDYGLATDLALLNATDDTEYVMEQIHSDVDSKDLLVSKMAALKDAKKLSKICALIDVSEQFSVKFSAAVENCFKKYQQAVVPELPTIIKQLQKLTSQHDNAILRASDFNVTKKNIQNLISLVHSETKNIEKRAGKAIKLFKKCIQSSGNECEQQFNKIHRKIQTVLN